MSPSVPTIYFDGHSSPHKKTGAGAVIAVDYGTRIDFGKILKLPNDATNNQAEYEGFVLALREAVRMAFPVNIAGDSRLVIDSFKRIIKLKNNQLKIFKTLADMEFSKAKDYIVKIFWVPRKDNKAGWVFEDLNAKKRN